MRGALEGLISMYWAGGEEPQVLGELGTHPVNLCNTLINTHIHLHRQTTCTMLATCHEN